MNSKFNRYKVLFLHFSFWCVYLSFSLYQFSQFRQGKNNINWNQALVYITIQFFFNIASAYINYFIFLPRWLKSKNVWRYILEFFPVFALIITARVHLLRFVTDGYTYKELFFYSSFFIVQTVAITLFIVIFVGMLRFAKDWFDLEAKKQEIENEKLSAELNFLKAQINPHFLFNTLNNLYYLAYSKSDNTTEVIAKLSQMMRYMIYDSNHEKVPLKKEIEYMENYISLEKLRLNNQIPIKFELTGNPEQFWIVPLIFITFLENAFKHGVSNNNPSAWVNINVVLENNASCTYIVENSKLIKANTNSDDIKGIGLQNVKRRLELSYPEQYDLQVENLPDRYRVQLKLNLA